MRNLQVRTNVKGCHWALDEGFGRRKNNTSMRRTVTDCSS